MSHVRTHGSSRHGHTHGRLHRRGNSASSLTSPLSPGSQLSFSPPGVTYEEPWTNTITRPMPRQSSHSQKKIKPYLRKLSSHKDHRNDLDLSRPASENERLTGLGITEYGGYTPSAGDVSFAPVKPRNHARSTSNTSQFSTSSSLQRPLPPIRQTPRPYTPPISKSTPASVLLNGDNDSDNVMTDDEVRLRQNAYEPGRKSGSLSSSTPGAPHPLRIQTTGSSSFLPGSYSQSTVSLTSPIAQSRSRGDTVKSLETTSPSSRTSFDKAFGFIRPGRDSPALDAQSRAASIRAARQAFEEKEAAKDRKYDREVHKQVERETRKQVKKEEREARKSESHEKKRSRSISDSTAPERASRPSVGGRQYSDYREAHTSTLPNHVSSVDPEKPGYSPAPVTAARQAKGRWIRFLIWIRTRILRVKTNLHVAA